MRLLFEIAAGHIRGRGRQTLVSIVGVALGVGFAVAMSALMVGSQNEFVRTLIDAMPHVRISDAQRAAPPQPADTAFDLAQYSGLRPKSDLRGVLNPTAARASLRAWAPGALSASLTLSGVARFGGAEAGVSLIGVEPEREIRVSTVEGDMVAGSLRELRAQSFGVAMGVGLAQKLGAEFGDTVRLVSGDGRSRGFKIVALFRTGVVATDESRAYILLKSAQALADRPNAVNEIRLKLSDPHAARAVAARAEEMLGYQAVSWQEANAAILENFTVRNVIMYTVVGAILIVAGFGVFNVVSIITHEKSRDIAIMKSLGFTARDIRRIFLAEGLFMGAAGSVVGWGVGYALTRALGAVTFNLPGSSETTRLPVEADPLHYAIATLCALGAAGVAGYLPARRAARLDPVEIIRGAS